MAMALMANGTKKVPNRLRDLKNYAGYTWQELADETNIPEGTLRRWASGGIIPHQARLILAPVIGCEVCDLAPTQ